MAQDPIAKVKECFAARHERVSPELPAHKASIETTASNKGKIVHRLSAVELTSPAGRVVPACW